MRNGQYWNSEGAKKVFTHPICSAWVASLDRQTSILDLGCGYGRLTPALMKDGFSMIVGYDSSAALIKRAIRENPGAHYTSNWAALLDTSFDLILCFALFTSCPSSEEQRELVSLIDACSHQNALLHISDYETGDNPNYQDRYEQRRLNTFGCFASGNAIFRHHEDRHFDRLLTNWRKKEERTLHSTTLNGNNIIIHQYLFAKAGGPY
jgi:SAM-dependent methyltransferase